MSADEASIPAAMNTLLELFATELADVRFGDLDRAALDQAADAVRAAATDLAEANAAAEAARAALEAARETLLHKGQRALAYARIYAEANPPLADRLQVITITRPGTRRPDPGAPGLADPPRRRGRPPKTPAAEDTGTLPLTTMARQVNGVAESSA